MNPEDDMDEFGVQLPDPDEGWKGEAKYQRARCAAILAQAALAVAQLRPATNADDMVGRKVTPKRYQCADGREMIDRIRDDMTDEQFAYGYCRGCAMKYERELDAERAAYDAAKREFYIDMMSHVVAPDRYPDPRSENPDFKPYVRQEPK